MAEAGYLGTKKSPTALTIVILMHGAAIGALALSKMDVIPEPPKPIPLINLETPKPPPEIPPEPVKPQVEPPVQRQVVTMPPRIIERPVEPTFFDSTPVLNPPALFAKPGPVDTVPPPPPPPPPPPKPEPKKVQPARAKANLGSYVSDADYPAAAIRGEEQGTTRFRLTVGPDGRVKECAVTGSSGSSSLDATTCRLMKNRARFTAAQDSSGNATGDVVSSTIRWVLPE